VQDTLGPDGIARPVRALDSGTIFSRFGPRSACPLPRTACPTRADASTL